MSQGNWASRGGSGGVGGDGSVDIKSVLYEIANGDPETIVAPGLLTAGNLGINYAIGRKLGATVGTISQSGHVSDGPLAPFPVGTGTEIIWPRYTVDGGVSWHIGMLTGESLGTWTWTNLLALTAANYDGAMSYVTGAVLDLTGTGSDTRPVQRISLGDRWRPPGNSQLHRILLAPLTAITATSETISSGALVELPGSQRAISDTIRVKVVLFRTGASGNVTWTIHMGPAGTVADPVIESNVLSTAQVGFGQEFMILIEAADSARITGTNNASAPMGGTNTIAGEQPSTAVTAANLTGASSLYVSLGLVVGNAADSVKLVAFEVEHIYAP